MRHKMFLFHCLKVRMASSLFVNHNHRFQKTSSSSNTFIYCHKSLSFVIMHKRKNKGLSTIGASKQRGQWVIKVQWWWKLHSRSQEDPSNMSQCLKMFDDIRHECFLLHFQKKTHIDVVVNTNLVFMHWTIKAQCISTCISSYSGKTRKPEKVENFQPPIRFPRSSFR